MRNSLLEENSVEKLKYSLSGNLIVKVKDTIQGNVLIRNRDNKTIYIEDGVPPKVTQVRDIIQLKPLDVPEIKGIS